MLGNDNDIIIKGAATCVAAIAVLDIPENEWQDLIPTLT